MNRPVVEVRTVNETPNTVHAYQCVGKVWNSLVLRCTFPLRWFQCSTTINVLLLFHPHRTSFLICCSSCMLVANVQATTWHA